MADDKLESDKESPEITGEFRSPTNRENEGLGIDDYFHSPDQLYGIDGQQLKPSNDIPVVHDPTPSVDAPYTVGTPSDPTRVQEATSPVIQDTTDTGQLVYGPLPPDARPPSWGSERGPQTRRLYHIDTSQQGIDPACSRQEKFTNPKKSHKREKSGKIQTGWDEDEDEVVMRQEEPDITSPQRYIIPATFERILDPKLKLINESFTPDNELLDATFMESPNTSFDGPCTSTSSVPRSQQRMATPSQPVPQQRIPAPSRTCSEMREVSGKVVSPVGVEEEDVNLNLTNLHSPFEDIDGNPVKAPNEIEKARGRTCAAQNTDTQPPVSGQVLYPSNQVPNPTGPMQRLTAHFQGPVRPFTRPPNNNMAYGQYASGHQVAGMYGAPQSQAQNCQLMPSQMNRQRALLRPFTRPQMNNMAYGQYPTSHLAAGMYRTPQSQANLQQIAMSPSEMKRDAQQNFMPSVIQEMIQELGYTPSQIQVLAQQQQPSPMQKGSGAEYEERPHQQCGMRCQLAGPDGKVLPNQNLQEERLQSRKQSQEPSIYIKAMARPHPQPVAEEDLGPGDIARPLSPTSNLPSNSRPAPVRTFPRGMPEFWSEKKDEAFKKAEDKQQQGQTVPFNQGKTENFRKAPDTIDVVRSPPRCVSMTPPRPTQRPFFARLPRSNMPIPRSAAACGPQRPNIQSPSPGEQGVCSQSQNSQPIQRGIGLPGGYPRPFPRPQNNNTAYGQYPAGHLAAGMYRSPQQQAQNCQLMPSQMNAQGGPFPRPQMNNIANGQYPTGHLAAGMYRSPQPQANLQQIAMSPPAQASGPPLQPYNDPNASQSQLQCYGPENSELPQGASSQSQNTQPMQRGIGLPGGYPRPFPRPQNNNIAYRQYPTGHLAAGMYRSPQQQAQNCQLMPSQTNAQGGPFPRPQMNNTAYGQYQTGHLTAGMYGASQTQANLKPIRIPPPSQTGVSQAFSQATQNTYPITSGSSNQVQLQTQESADLCATRERELEIERQRQADLENVSREQCAEIARSRSNAGSGGQGEPGGPIPGTEVCPDDEDEVASEIASARERLAQTRIEGGGPGEPDCEDGGGDWDNSEDADESSLTSSGTSIKGNFDKTHYRSFLPRKELTEKAPQCCIKNQSEPKAKSPYKSYSLAGPLSADPKEKNPLNDMTKTYPRDMRKILICKLCNRYLTEDPRILPCFHLFCKSCLIASYVNNFPGEVVACPTCGYKFKMHKTLRQSKIKKAIFMKRTLEYSIRKHYHVPEYCTNANIDPSNPWSQDPDHPRAKYRCRYCQLDYCTECDRKHRRENLGHRSDEVSDYMKDLYTFVLPDEEILCNVHQVPFTSFCSHPDCNLPLCHYCGLEHKVEHRRNLVTLSQTVKNFKGAIDSYMTDQFFLAEDHMAGQLKQLASRRKTLRFTANHIYDTLAKRKAKAKKYVDKLMFDMYEECHARLRRNLIETFRDILGQMHTYRELEQCKMLVQTIRNVASCEEVDRLRTMVAVHMATFMQIIKSEITMESVKIISGLRGPQCSLGAYVCRSKLLRKFKTMPYPVECIAVHKGADLIITIHRSSIKKRRTIVHVTATTHEEKLAWNSILLNYAPRAYSVAFIKFGGSDYLCVVDRQPHVDTHKPDVHKQEETVWCKEEKDKPAYGKIVLLWPKREIIEIRKNDNFNPLAVAPVIFKNGFLYTNAICKTHNPSVKYWKKVADITSDYTVYQRPTHMNRLNWPEFMHTNTSNEILILDTARLYFMNPQGQITHLYRIHSESKENIPTNFCLDEDDFIYICYQHGHRVDRLFPNGEFEDTYLDKQDGVDCPTSVCVYNKVLLVGEASGYVGMYMIQNKYVGRRNTKK